MAAVNQVPGVLGLLGTAKEGRLISTLMRLADKGGQTQVAHDMYYVEGVQGLCSEVRDRRTIVSNGELLYKFPQ